MATTSSRTKKSKKVPSVATSARVKKSAPDPLASVRTKKPTPGPLPSPAPLHSPATAVEKPPVPPPKELEFSMESVTFVCKADKKPIHSDVSIKNITTAEMAFKVKCTSQDIFRVLPPSGFLKAGETQNLRIWFQNKGIPPAVPKHYFAIYYHKKEEGKTLQELWAQATKTNRVQRLPAFFTTV